MSKHLKPKLSFAVSCYNKSKYIRRCLDSLAITSYDVSVIDDNSTDNSYDIISEYAFKHERLDKNHGVSHVRNKQIDECKSDYIIFLDGDDFVVPHQDLTNVLNGAELYIAPYYFLPGNRKSSILVNEMISNRRQMSSVIVNIKALKKYDIRFNEKLKNLEDLEFIHRLFKVTKPIYIDIPYYTYNKNESGKRIRNSTESRIKLNIILDK